MDNYRGIAVRVLVDGRSAGIAAWKPNKVESTTMLARTSNEVELRLEVISHRRNSQRKGGEALY